MPSRNGKRVSEEEPIKVSICPRLAISETVEDTDTLLSKTGEEHVELKLNRLSRPQLLIGMREKVVILFA